MRASATATSAAPDPAGDAAVHVQLGTRHPVGLVRREVDEGVGVVDGLAEATEGVEVLSKLPGRGGVGLVVEVAIDHRRVGEARADAVGANVLLGTVDGHALGQHD